MPAGLRFVRMAKTKDDYSRKGETDSLVRIMIPVCNGIGVRLGGACVRKHSTRAAGWATPLHTYQRGVCVNPSPAKAVICSNQCNDALHLCARGF